MSASARSTDRTQSRLSTDARITSIAELDAEVRMAAHVIGSNGEGPNRALLDEKRRVLLSRKASEESRTAAVIACATAARDGRVVGRAERNADQIQAKREYQQATRHERLQEYRTLEAARRRLEEQRMMLEAQRVDEAAKLEQIPVLLAVIKELRSEVVATRQSTEDELERQRIELVGSVRRPRPRPAPRPAPPRRRRGRTPRARRAPRRSPSALAALEALGQRRRATGGRGSARERRGGVAAGIAGAELDAATRRPSSPGAYSPPTRARRARASTRRSRGTPTSPRPRPVVGVGRSTDRTQSRLSTDAPPRSASVDAEHADGGAARRALERRGRPNRALLDEAARPRAEGESRLSRTAAVIACATAARDLSAANVDPGEETSSRRVGGRRVPRSRRRAGLERAADDARGAARR